ncbi:hypothetical protein SAMN05661096_00656 [Marivirga sericea]|uniref:Uncharacterized protein n=1 Tax=Marivirga sericea TaxID=1028 RepID=A0A1X7IID8_9BACT|nr:hypothetical protein [Marivirga sericea]SMG14201.1 hypothetical protein SAMN05661096_00656 [Marivirga sericea]
MGKFKYTPDTLDRVNKVCKDKAFKIFQRLKDHRTSVTINEIESCLKSFSEFIIENNHEIGSLPYVLEVDFSQNDDSPGNLLSPKVILDAIKDNDNLLLCTKTFEVKSTDRLSRLDNFSVADRSLNEANLFFFIENGLDTSIYIKGVPTIYFNPIHPKAEPPQNNKYKRIARDYELALIDFYKVEVRTWRTGHWKDKQKRILIGDRKTEDVFQQALYQWLDLNLSTCTVTQKVRKLSTDETDIEIMEHGGNNHLLEIKWLGKNPSTEYKYDKVDDAVHQVKNYLEENSGTLSAALVVYDGRTEEEFNCIVSEKEDPNNWKLIKESNGVHLPEKGVGYIFFLISKTASKRTSA